MAVRQENLRKLTEAARKELALALLLWKDFKSDGKLNVDAYREAEQFAKQLGIEKEFERAHSEVPPLKILPRFSACALHPIRTSKIRIRSSP